MLRKIRDYFYFRRSEAIGSLILVAAIIAVISFFDRISPETGTSQIDTLAVKEQLRKADSIRSSEQIPSASELYFEFDPNLAGKNVLESTGMSKRAVRNLIKYREKGGRIEGADDLLKMYGIDTAWFYRHRNDIVIAGKKLEPDPSFEPLGDNLNDELKVSDDSIPITELNELSEGQLSDLGIRSFIAKRFLKYRRMLGGFNNYEQLIEVYDMADWEREKLERYTTIKPKSWQSIALADSNFKKLLRHPYLDFKLTKAMLLYTKKNNLQELDQLREMPILPDSLYQKIAPYLVISPKE